MIFRSGGFETEFGKPTQRGLGLDMCLTSRSLVSRLVTFLFFEGV